MISWLIIGGILYVAYYNQRKTLVQEIDTNPLYAVTLRQEQPRNPLNKRGMVSRSEGADRVDEKCLNLLDAKYIAHWAEMKKSAEFETLAPLMDTRRNVSGNSVMPRRHTPFYST